MRQSTDDVQHTSASLSGLSLKSRDVPDYAPQQHINTTFHAQEPNLASGHSQSWRLDTGTNFRFNCDNAAEWLHSNDNLKLITSILL